MTTFKMFDDGEAVMDDLSPGDTALIKGLVTEVVPGLGVNVTVSIRGSRTDLWIAPDDLAGRAVVDAPDEPPNLTWLGGTNSDGEPAAFHRDDSKAPHKQGRRYQQHWFDLQRGDWIDWPQAIARGAGAFITMKARIPARTTPYVIAVGKHWCVARDEADAEGHLAATVFWQARYLTNDWARVVPGAPNHARKFEQPEDAASAYASECGELPALPASPGVVAADA